ncbi:MAG: glycosyltransferase [Candidatus Micrarchaeota archaeon]
MTKRVNYQDTTVIVPTLNERKNIGILVRRLFFLYPKIRVLVVDDGSRDGTIESVKSLARRNPNLRLLDRTQAMIHGLTASVIDGLLACTTRFSTVMDGDMQHPPEKVGEIVGLLRGNAEIVVGVRKGEIKGWALHRRLISNAATLLGKLRLLFSGKDAADVLSGFFGIRSALAKKIIEKGRGRFEERGYKVLFDILKQVSSETKLSEVGYRFGMRQGGSSKIRTKHILFFIYSLVK